MLFNSLPFAVFLPTVVGVYWLLPARLRPAMLLGASYLFYGWWDARFLGLLLLSTLTDYVAGRRIVAAESRSTKRSWLVISLLANLGILGFFKYWNFFVDSAASLLREAGLQVNQPTLRVLLPVGISFYTFQTLSYTIDVFRGRMQPEENVVRFGLFVAFFPQLVAGPIERASRLLPQLRSLPERWSQVDWRGSLTLIGRGLFRKVVIADGVAPLVNQVFGTPQRFGAITVALGVIGFSLQIYGDFSGYTDMARGTARLFGVELMENFHVPYGARSFSEFWRRWHVSLSTWLRDYLYIPLGGSRGGKPATYRNLILTMLLGGLWHGAGWGFVLWGALHGAFLVAERLWAESSEKARTRLALPPAVVFALVTLAWIPFRAPTLSGAGEVLTALTRFDGGQLGSAPLVVAVAALATIWIDRSVLAGREDPVVVVKPLLRGIAYGTAILVAFLMMPTGSVPFIYFQF